MFIAKYKYYYYRFYLILSFFPPSVLATSFYIIYNTLKI